MSSDVSAMFCPILHAAFFLRSIVSSVSSSAIVCQMFLHTHFLHHQSAAHTHTRAAYPSPRSYLRIFNSSPFLHISASCSYHLPLCVLDTHARVAPLYFRLSQNNLPSSSPSSSSSSFCTRLHRWLWIPTISAYLCTQKDRFVV
jgi:hypothetical protein